MEDRGGRRSQWTVIRRCIMLVARLLKSPASGTELLAIVSLDEDVPSEALTKRFEEDRARLRELGCVMEYHRSDDMYELKYAGIFRELLDVHNTPPVHPGDISPTTFIRVWQGSESIKEIVRRLQITSLYAKSKAGYYRQRGVPLKHFSTRGAGDGERAVQGGDWNELAQLAESLDKSDAVLRNKVTAEDFIRAWQGSTSTKEVAGKLGLSPGVAGHTATQFRKMGVPLKSYRTTDVDWTAMANLANSLLKDKSDG